jgi:hypothetical protein
MQYDTFVETLDVFPSGRYIVNSCQLRDLLNHHGCKGASVRVLHIGTIALQIDILSERLKTDQHPRLDDIKITCLDGVIIIDEPSHGAS